MEDPKSARYSTVRANETFRKTLDAGNGANYVQPIDRFAECRDSRSLWVVDVVPLLLQRDHGRIEACESRRISSYTAERSIQKSEGT